MTMDIEFIEGVSIKLAHEIINREFYPKESIDEPIINDNGHIVGHIILWYNPLGHELDVNFYESAGADAGPYLHYGRFDSPYPNQSPWEEKKRPNPAYIGSVKEAEDCLIKAEDDYRHECGILDLRKEAYQDKKDILDALEAQLRDLQEQVETAKKEADKAAEDLNNQVNDVYVAKAVLGVAQHDLKIRKQKAAEKAKADKAEAEAKAKAKATGEAELAKSGHLSSMSSLACLL